MKLSPSILAILTLMLVPGHPNAETATLRDGIWAETPQECDSNYMEPTTRMELRAGAIKFYESNCRIKSVAKIGSERISAVASCADPDGTFSMSLIFKILDSATVVQLIDGAPPLTRHLCTSSGMFAQKPPKVPTLHKEACGQVDATRCISSEPGKSQNTWRVKNTCPYRVAATIETTVPPSYVRRAREALQFGKAPSADYHGVESGSKPVVISASCIPG